MRLVAIEMRNKCTDKKDGKSLIAHRLTAIGVTGTSIHRKTGCNQNGIKKVTRLRRKDTYVTKIILRLIYNAFNKKEMPIAPKNKNTCENDIHATTYVTFFGYNVDGR